MGLVRYGYALAVTVRPAESEVVFEETEMKIRCSVLALAGLAGLASAQPVIDGTRDAEYGAPVSVQTVNTQFGDASPPGNLGGSELNAAYARIQGGRLFLMLTGNHEPNFNKLEVFIDSRAGGENQLSSTPQYDFNTGGGWISQNLGGMTFDAGFSPDYHMFARWGSGNGPYQVDFIDRQGGVNAQVPGNSASGSMGFLTSSGVIGPANLGPNASGSALSDSLFFAINNFNAGGVGGGTGAADQGAAAAVTTGMEFSISLADLGNPAPGTVIRIAAMINNGDHNYLSNQVLGGLPANTGNLGGTGDGGFTGSLAGVNFNNFAGNQYFEVVVPTPGALALLGLGGLAIARRRR